MFKLHLRALFVTLLTCTASVSAANHVLKSVAYEEIAGVLIAQITLSDLNSDLVFIHATSQSSPSKMLANWDEGDSILVSTNTTQKQYEPSHELTLVNANKNQRLQASITEETLKALPRIDSITYECVPHFYLLQKEKVTIGLSNGVFYQTEKDDQVEIVKLWAKGDHVIVSDVEKEQRLLVNLDKPGSYRGSSRLEGRKVFANQL